MRYVTASHVAQLLGATVEQVNDLARDGTLPAARLVLVDNGDEQFIFEPDAVRQAVAPLVATGRIQTFHGGRD